MKSTHAAALHIVRMARLEWQSFCFRGTVGTWCHGAQPHSPDSNFLVLFIAYFTSNDTGCQHSNAGLEFFIVKQIHNAHLSNCGQTMSMLFTSQCACDNALPLRWGFVAGSHSQIHVSSPVIIFKKNSGSLLSLSGMSWHVLSWISYCSSPSRQGTSLVAITYIFILAFKMLWKSVPNKVPNAFWTSQTAILLFFEDKFPHSIHIFIRSAHQWTSQMFSIFYTASELQKPLKNLCSFNSLFFKNYLQHFESFCTIFTSLSQNLMQTCFQGTPKLQMGQHMCVLRQTLLQYNHVSQPHSKQAVTQQPQHHLHLMVTVLC